MSHGARRLLGYAMNTGIPVLDHYYALLLPAVAAAAAAAKLVNTPSRWVAQAKRPKLDIKKDAKGMVVVPGATVLEVTSAKQLLACIQGGQNHRHVASTQVPLLPSTSPPPAGTRACSLRPCKVVN